MSVFVWWILPVVATGIAIVWTAALRRRERRRADDRWRAAKLASVGPLLVDPSKAPVAKPVAADSPNPATSDTAVKAEAQALAPAAAPTQQAGADGPNEAAPSEAEALLDEDASVVDADVAESVSDAEERV